MSETLDTRSATDASGARIAAQDVVHPQLVLLLERARPLAGGARHSLARIDRVTFGRGAVRAARRIVVEARPTLEITIPDDSISQHHARLDRVEGTWQFVDCDSTNGSRVNRSRTSMHTLADGDVLELGRTLFRYRAGMTTPANAAADVDSESLRGLSKSFGTLLPLLERDLDTLARVARSDSTVLLLGETGTGKEVLARGIHELSGRTGPFVAVNCGGIPATLIESLFFGHKKGSFSGAVRDEIGFVRAAHGGTLFLDEVGDLPSSGQTALLRVLQEREVIPVGLTQPLEVDIRVLAATHRPLRRLVQSGAFRHDLFARLSAFTHVVPPLRERIDDIGVLIAALLRRSADRGEIPLSLSSAAAHALVEYEWPHNIRELQQRLKLGTMLGSNGRIDLGPPLLHERVEIMAEPPARRGPTIDEVQIALREAPSMAAAAKILGVHRSHLYRLIRHFGIHLHRKVSGEGRA